MTEPDPKDAALPGDARKPIRLDDLVPRRDVKGGGLLFGASPKPIRKPAPPPRKK